MGESSNVYIQYFGFRCHRTKGSVYSGAVRGNKGALLRWTHLSLIPLKKASLSLLSKSKNLAFSGLLCTGLFNVAVSRNASSLELISPALDVSASGCSCSAGLDMWMVNLEAGVCFASKVSAMMGQNHTFFLYEMGLLLVS